AAACALAGAALVAFGVIVVRSDARVMPLASSPEAIRDGGKTAQPLSRTSPGSRCRQRKPADRRRCARAAAGTRRGTGLIAFGSTLGSYSHLSEYSLVVFGGDFRVARRLKGNALHYEEVSVCADW